MRVRLLVLIIPVFLLVLASIYFYLPFGQIPRGVSLAGVSIGGLSLKQAQDVVNSEAELILRPFVLKHPGRSETFTLKPEDFKVQVCTDPINEALKEMAEGSLLKRLAYAVKAGLFGCNLEFRIDYSGQDLKEAVEGINGLVGEPPKNASIDPFTGEMTPERTGLGVDRERLIRDILDRLPDPNRRSVTMKLIELKPDLTLSRLYSLGFRTPVGWYETEFDRENRERSENIRLSCEAISGTLLSPGEGFSFNKTTGPRDREHGYQQAMVIVDGEFVPGYGGGVCQVSTTLYNAVLLSGLEVTCRRPHGRPVNYVPYGRDATVADELIDFRFRNSSTSPILVSAGVRGDRVRVAIYGKKDSGIEVKIITSDPEIIERGRKVTEDLSLPPGNEVIEEKGYDGLRVKVERVFLRNGREIIRELISRDTYPAKDDKVRVGPGAGKEPAPGE